MFIDVVCIMGKGEIRCKDYDRLVLLILLCKFMGMERMKFVGICKKN